LVNGEARAAQTLSFPAAMAKSSASPGPRLRRKDDISAEQSSEGKLGMKRLPLTVLPILLFRVAAGAF
jgi:hypothetical protein